MINEFYNCGGSVRVARGGDGDVGGGGGGGVGVYTVE